MRGPYVKVSYQPEATPATPYSVEVVSNRQTTGRRLCRDYAAVDRYIRRENLDHLPIR